MSVEVFRLWPSQWRDYKEIRLRTLKESPESFASTHDRESVFSDDQWEQSMIGRAIIVASDNDRLIGLIIGSTDANDHTQGHIYSVWVDPKYRGQGIVKQLHDAVVLWAQENGISTLVSGYVKGNISAQSAYRKYGFVETGRQKPLDRDPNVSEIEITFHIE